MVVQEYRKVDVIRGICSPVVLNREQVMHVIEIATQPPSRTLKMVLNMNLLGNTGVCLASQEIFEQFQHLVMPSCNACLRNVVLPIKLLDTCYLQL